MKCKEKYYYVKLYEQDEECDYPSYSAKKILFKVKGDRIENKEEILFPFIPAGTEVLITHIVIHDPILNISLKRNLKKIIKTNSTDSQRPIFAAGSIKTLNKDIL